MQEAELSSKKQELEEVKTQENKLEKNQFEMSKKLEELNNLLQNSQLQISQVSHFCDKFNLNLSILSSIV